MLTHLNSGDEGGLLINEDGAYLWNSTDSSSLLRGMDEDQAQKRIVHSLTD